VVHGVALPELLGQMRVAVGLGHLGGVEATPARHSQVPAPS